MLLIAGLAGLFLLPTPWNVVAVVVAAAVEVAEVAFWLGFLRRYRVRTGAEGMIGARGRAVERVTPEGGRVRVSGELWSARSAEPLEPGAAVAVTRVEGLTLEVERATEKGP